MPPPSISQLHEARLQSPAVSGGCFSEVTFARRGLGGQRPGVLTLQTSEERGGGPELGDPHGAHTAGARPLFLLH